MEVELIETNDKCLKELFTANKRKKVREKGQKTDGKQVVFNALSERL